MWGRVPAQLLIFAATSAAMMGVLSMTRGLVDADYYWHVTAGELIAKNGVLASDPFSYTWGGQPWVMHEWAGELAIYALTSSIGPETAAFAFGVIATLGPLAVALALRRRVPFAALAPAWAIVLYLLTPFATIRPQVLSWVFIGLLLAGMIAVNPSRRFLPWLAAPLFLVWANTHGLYVVGLGVLAAYTVMTWLRWTPMATAPGRVTGILLASIAASMATPAGPEALTYPLRYLDIGDWGLQHIAEWQSPNFHDPGQLAFLLFVGLLVIVAARGQHQWLTVMAACGVMGGLLALRNVPLAAVLAMPALVLGLGERYLAWRPSSVAEATHAAPLARHAMEAALGITLIVATAIIVPRLPRVAGDAVISRAFPVDAVAVLADRQPNARVFAEYQWAGFVINHLYAEGARVFVDGRNDMYPEEILRDFVNIRNAAPDWRTALDHWGGADAILLPPEAPLAHAAQQAGWCVAHAEAVSVLLLRCETANAGGHAP